MTQKTENCFDVIIVGGGVSGLSAAMYSARLNLKVIVFGSMSTSEEALGGVITTTNVVENYPGFSFISGYDLANKIKEHAEGYEQVTLKECRVVSVHLRDNQGFQVVTEDRKEYRSKAIIFATGTKWRKLNVPGSIEFENKGVAYCALCDAPLYRNKTAAVVGGSDSAVKDALVLAEHASKVYIIYRKDKVRAEPANMKKLAANSKIEVINFTNVVEIQGEKRVTNLILDKEHNGSYNLAVNGVFIAIGHDVLSELAEKIGVSLNEKKEITINHQTCETTVPGVFAAGDVADKPFKQAITGAAEGCLAAYGAFTYISHSEVNPCSD